MSGFVYLWYDKKRKMFYIGCHWGNENDGYICSSNRMRDAYRRRKEDFKRRIVKKIYTNRAELLNEEHRWLQMIPKEELGKRYYNHRNHKFNHWALYPYKRICSEETKRKISKSNKGKPKSEETKAKLKEKRKYQIIIHSEETKRKISQSEKGKTISKETREKISKSLVGHIPWNKGLTIDDPRVARNLRRFRKL